MTRKFKMAGVLMAVVAMFAVMASSASAGTFTSAAGYPETASGTSTADVFDAFGSTVECKENKFTGTLPAASSTFTVTAEYNKCTAFGLPATVNMTNCHYVFHTTKVAPFTHVDLECPSGGADITIYSSSSHSTALCHVVVTGFTGKNGVTLANNGNHVKVTGTVEGITAHQERTNFLCPAGTETNAAKYTVQAAGITMIGAKGAVSVS